MEVYVVLVLLVSTVVMTSSAPPSAGGGSGQRVRRQAVATDSGLWPQGRITYTFSTQLERDVRTRRAIKSAIRHWEEKTCVTFTFVPIDAISLPDNYIVFEGGHDCSSSVGMTGGPQTIKLSRSCAYTAMIVHELGHALGLWHEHCRPDRDAHVNVLWKNIKDASKHNFDKQVDARLLTPYDMFSIMHYEPRMFSKHGRSTLQTLDPRLHGLVGRHSSLSHYDQQTINKLYTCAARCSSPPVCEHDGFVTSSCVCQCPRGLTGERCHLVDTEQGCGGVVRAEDGMVLRSALLTDNTVRSGGGQRKCVWLLQSPEKTVISVNLTSLDLDKADGGECKDEVEVRYHSIGVPQGYKICKGKKMSPEVLLFESVDNKIMIHEEGDGESTFIAKIRVSPRKDCSSSPCQNGASCEDLPAIKTYLCHCPQGWIGKDCELQIVNGGWSSWSSWSQCVAKCGYSTRRRRCNNPVPAYGGRGCHGITYQTQRCQGVNCQDYFSCDFGTQRYADRCSLVPAETSVAPLQWLVTSGNTPSPKTGPEGGHTTGDRGDMYMYLEASRGKKGERAISWYPVREAAGLYCLELYYSLFGTHIGTLAVVRRDPLRTREAFTPLWQKTGNQGPGWRVIRLNVYLRPSEQLGFVAVRGATYQGDIAIDDITLSPGRCVRRNRRRVRIGAKRQPGHKNSILNTSQGR